jgi:hypothetical protein
LRETMTMKEMEMVTKASAASLRCLTTIPVRLAEGVAGIDGEGADAGSGSGGAEAGLELVRGAASAHAAAAETCVAVLPGCEDRLGGVSPRRRP